MNGNCEAGNANSSSSTSSGGIGNNDNNNTDSSNNNDKNSRHNNPQAYGEEDTPTPSSGEASSPEHDPQTGELSRNGAGSSWSYAESGQHYSEYQDPEQQEGQSYNKQPYSQEAGSQNSIKQGEQQHKRKHQQSEEHQEQGQPHKKQQQSANEQFQNSQASTEQQQALEEESGKCWECGSTFQDDELLRDHLALFHADIQIYKCHTCPAVYPSQSSLTKHITSTHLVGASIQSANKSQHNEDQSEEEDSEEEEQSNSISIGGGSSLSSLLGKGISVSGGDTSLSSLQAKGIAISSSTSALSSLKGKGISISGSSDSSPLSSLEAKGISISGQGESPLKSLQAKGISISGNSESSLSSLQAKGISISGKNESSSLSSLQAKGISISGAESSGGSSALSLLQSKGISVSGGCDSPFAALQAKGISVSGNSDSESTSLQAKGVSLSGISISGGSESSLSSLQAKGISVSGSSESSLSSLQAKGISISGGDSSQDSKGALSSGGDSALSFLQSKGISISGATSSVQSKASDSSPLSLLQAKGISISGSSSPLSSLKAKGISISGATSSSQNFEGETSDPEGDFSESGSDSEFSESDSLPLLGKGVSLTPAKTSLASLQGKGASLSAANPALSLLQAKGISLSAASSQPLSPHSKEGSSASSSPVPPPEAKRVSTPDSATSTASTPKTRSPAAQGKGSTSKQTPSATKKSSSSSSKDFIPSYFTKAAPRSVVHSRVAYLKAKGFDYSFIRQPTPPPPPVPVTKARESPRRWRNFGCVYCHINRFKSTEEFENHHIDHAEQTTAKVILLQVDPKAYEGKVRRKRHSSELKLKLRISKVGRGKGRKRREVRIVSNEEGMSESHKSLEDREGLVESQEGEGEAVGTDSLTGEESEGGQSQQEFEEEEGASSASYQESVDHHGESSSGHVADSQQEDFEQEEQGSHEDSSEHQEAQGQEENPPTQHQEETHRYNTRSSSHQNNNSNSGFEGSFNAQDLGFGAAGPSEAPPSTYQPQFESFPTSDWFSEYESGSRIVAAMAGATTAEPASDGGWGTNADGSANPEYTSADTNKDGPDHSVNGRQHEESGEDGLFSQAVLGQESPDKNDRQGSFEQLCLNDTYSGQPQDGTEDQSDQMEGVLSEEEQQQQQQQQQQQGVTNDLLSELEYLNNSGQPPHSSQMDGSPHSGGPSPHSGGPGTPGHLSSRGSNSGTPTSSGGHPTPPPTDTSFRALATSPMTSPNQATSPAGMQGHTPPVSSPLQQSGDQQQSGVPRLTIANNLMAPTTSSQLPPASDNNQAGVGGMMSRYGNQWPQGTGYGSATGYGNLPGATMPNSNMPGSLRAPLPPSVGMPYRPSPPARVRGRPPLMGQIGRPPLHQGSLLQPARGPGRPPASAILPPPLMPAPGQRSSMMPPLQRMHQNMYQGQRPGGPQQQNGAAKRPLLGSASHSPSKNARREDINVPSRQKDSDCQIIAVANRSDGLPVIANVQGGGAASNRSGSAPPTTSESTINLSDSITLSVRTSGSDKPAQRGERSGGDAGTVANLLASRGITVTPAAGEREGGGGGRDDRRLPTAQELNLSSAISVHPPTQREREATTNRDRDGFAVPQAPVRSSSTNSNVERPPRPPTVDLTQDVPSSGSQGTRHPCSQCDRTFPSASLLADHSRVHQQQQQSRMPYKCHLCTAGFSSQKGQQHHYQQFHQIHLSAGDIAIPLVDLRNPVNVQRMAALGIRSFVPLTNLQNRGAGGVVGIPVLTLENLRNGHMTLQQWGVSDVLSIGPAKTLNMPR